MKQFYLFGNHASKEINSQVGANYFYLVFQINVFISIKYYRHSRIKNIKMVMTMPESK